MLGLGPAPRPNHCIYYQMHALLAAGTYMASLNITNQWDYLVSGCFVILAVHINWLTSPAVWYQENIGLWGEVEKNVHSLEFWVKKKLP